MDMLQIIILVSDLLVHVFDLLVLVLDLLLFALCISPHCQNL